MSALTEGALVIQISPASWRRRIEFRFLVGIGIIIASVAGMMFALSTLNHTTAAYVAAESLPSGERIAVDQLKVVQVNLAEVSGKYLTPSDNLNGLRTGRPVRAGELIAKSAVSSAQDRATVTTVIPAQGPLPKGVAVGALVEVWAAADPSMRDQSAPPPKAIVGGVEVVRLTAATGFAASDTNNVEIRIPRRNLEKLLSAQAAGLRLTIVAEGSPQ